MLPFFMWELVTGGRDMNAKRRIRAIAATIACTITLASAQYLMLEPAGAQAKKAAAPAPKAQPVPRVFVAATAGKTQIFETNLGTEDVELLTFDRGMLSSDPNLATVENFGWASNIEWRSKYQAEFNSAIDDAAAAGIQTIVFIANDRINRAILYQSAKQRGVAMSVASDVSSDPAYKQLQAQYNNLASQLRTAENNMQIASQKRDAAAQSASAQAQSGGNPWMAIGGLVGAIANDYGYGDYYREAQSLRSQMSSIESSMKRMQAPKAATYFTADVSRQLFFDGELGLYLCNVKARRCTYTSRSVSTSKIIEGPLVTFKGEAAYQKDPSFAIWTEFENDVKTKSAFGFSLQQLLGTVDGQMLDIPVSGLAERIVQDETAFDNRMAQRDAPLRESDLAARAILLPIAKQLENKAYSGRKIRGVFEADLLLSDAEQKAHDAEEAKRKANLQGL
jgi:hypothetical protein